MKHWQLDILMTGHLFTPLQRVLDVNLSAALNVLAGRDITKKHKTCANNVRKRMKR